jgi:hypothetical protein
MSEKSRYKHLESGRRFAETRAGVVDMILQHYRLHKREFPQCIARNYTV